MIRLAAKAIIVENDKLLVLEHNNNGEQYFLLPGGGQDHKEDLHQTLRRECLEEIGAAVDVNDLLFVSEFISERHNENVDSDDFHQVDMFFSCNLLEDLYSHKATKMDLGQVGFNWIPLDEINNITLYPLALREHLCNIKNNRDTVYLGAVR